jgi:membrane associated rhomboid family serine protease
MVMPLWDDSPLKLPRLPIVTWGLIVINILVFAAVALAPPSWKFLFRDFAVTPANITSTQINPTPVPPYLRRLGVAAIMVDLGAIQ